MLNQQMQIWRIAWPSRQKLFFYCPFYSAMASGRSKNSRFNGLLSKKETVEKFFKIRACHFLRTPYNAPPLTRNNGK
ncbi:hypothetical protein MRY16398_54800 [Phytobacter sp. MRY16-398]|nr:hypothetical protein MRY16398_54800 [Phytobacter sp. MRY16-398]